MLHQHGHPEPERYTPSRILAYADAIWKRERHRYIEMITATRTASLAPEDYRDQMQKLTRKMQ